MPPVIDFSVVDPLDANTAKFISISNIVDGIQDFAQGGSLDPNVNLASARHILSRVSTSRRALNPSSQRLLRICWHTELAAQILSNLPTASGSAPDPELLATLRRVSSQTLPVQVYYAIFNAARCLTETLGSPCSTHAQVQRDFVNRTRSLAGPWAVTHSGDPEVVSTCTFSRNIAPGFTPFNPMEQGREPGEYLALGLRMTRRWQIESKRAEWLKNSAHRTGRGKPYKVLPSHGRSEILASLRPTTVLDLVYELRRRTNYESADEYGSHADDLAVARFHGGMLHLLDSGLLVYESELVRAIGIDSFIATSTAWRNSLGRINDWALRAFDRRTSTISTAAGR